MSKHNLLSKENLNIALKALGINPNKDYENELVEEDLHYETEWALQEWGIKNNLRLFGVEVSFSIDDKPQAKAFFTDTGFKSVMILYFEIKKIRGKVTVSRSKDKGTKWPIKFARTRNFQNESIDPINPLYWVLVGRGIILPFKSSLKQKDWDALPFVDMTGIKSTNKGQE